MSKVWCARTECKHLNQKGFCGKKEISIRAWEINTVNYGKKRMEECLCYEPSEDWKKIKGFLARLTDWSDAE
jgi:hypothetical protein